MTAKLPSAVCDTNILISAAINPRSLPALAVQKALRAGDVFASEETQEELLQVLRRKKFERYFRPEERDVFAQWVLGAVVRVTCPSHVHICRHAKDDKFLDVALASSADHLITGDADLLALHPFQSTAILTSAAYVAS